MMYDTENAKWNAYRFSDPFAIGSFFVCNKIDNYFCRPDCDSRPISNVRSDIDFVKDKSEAIKLGYNSCGYCDPMNVPLIDVKSLMECVFSINKNIGFFPPFFDNNNNTTSNLKDDKNKGVIKKRSSHNMSSKNYLPSHFNENFFVRILNMDGKDLIRIDNINVSKNDFDHYRLVDIACRHLALAAAMKFFHLKSSKNLIFENKSNESTFVENSSFKKKKRRRGVLGFKELAAKSKLSAWHFHRVFKSLTGFTPKNYGDRCWDFFKNLDKSIINTNLNLVKNSKKKKDNDNKKDFCSISNDSTVNENVLKFSNLSPLSLKDQNLDQIFTSCQNDLEDKFDLSEKLSDDFLNNDQLFSNSSFSNDMGLFDLINSSNFMNHNEVNDSFDSKINKKKHYESNNDSFKFNTDPFCFDSNSINYSNLNVSNFELTKMETNDNYDTINDDQNHVLSRISSFDSFDEDNSYLSDYISLLKNNKNTFDFQKNQLTTKKDCDPINSIFLSKESNQNYTNSNHFLNNSLHDNFYLYETSKKNLNNTDFELDNQDACLETVESYFLNNNSLDFFQDLESKSVLK